jgi:hypothetical protein
VGVSCTDGEWGKLFKPLVHCASNIASAAACACATMCPCVLCVSAHIVSGGAGEKVVAGLTYCYYWYSRDCCAEHTFLCGISCARSTLGSLPPLSVPGAAGHTPGVIADGSGS